MEKLTRSSLKVFLNRALFAYKNGRFASSFFSPLRYRTFISLEESNFTFQQSLSEAPFRPDRVSFCTPNKNQGDEGNREKIKEARKSQKQRKKTKECERVKSVSVLTFPNAVVLNAVGRRNTQMRAKDSK